METGSHTFLQVVKVPFGELWYSRNDELVLSKEDDVQILYSKALNKFILRLNDFKVVLDKSVHIISAIVGRNLRQAYLLPRGTGFTMIRLSNGKTYPALENFETILDNTSNFSRKSGLDATLANFKEIKENGGFASSLLTSMSKALLHPLDDSHPNQKINRNFEDLIDLDSHGVSVVDVPDAELASLSKKNELDNTGYEHSDIWKAFIGEGSFAGFPKQNETKEAQQSQAQPQEQSQERNSEFNGRAQAHIKSTISKDQEVVGAQEQRLPSYEVHNSTEFLRKNLRKASAQVQAGDSGSGSGSGSDEKVEENVELPDPVHYEEEAFTFGLLTKDETQVAKVGNGKEYPICNEDVFTDLVHPVRKLSLIERPFLNIDDESVEAEKPKAEPHKGFQGQPILTAKGQPTLKSNIDDQPSPIPNTEKYSEPTQPEKSSFAKPNTVGQPNIIRESSQGSETKKQRKITDQPIDKENLTAPTTV